MWNKGEIMDTKNPLKKGNRWYLNFTFPAKFAVEKLAGRKIRISLEASDCKLAHSIRDSYISNIIAANSKLQVVERLAKHLTGADEELKKMVAAKLLPVGYSHSTAKSLADLISKSAGKKTLSLSNIHFI